MQCEREDTEGLIYTVSNDMFDDVCNGTLMVDQYGSVFGIMDYSPLNFYNVERDGDPIKIWDDQEGKLWKGYMFSHEEKNSQEKLHIVTIDEKGEVGEVHDLITKKWSRSRFREVHIYTGAREIAFFVDENRETVRLAAASCEGGRIVMGEMYRLFME